MYYFYSCLFEKEHYKQNLASISPPEEDWSKDDWSEEKEIENKLEKKTGDEIKKGLLKLKMG